MVVKHFYNSLHYTFCVQTLYSRKNLQIFGKSVENNVVFAFNLDVL